MHCQIATYKRTHHGTRTITYVFLFDAAFTIFRNSPPRMVVSELKMETACPEASFQAGSAEECFAALEGWKQTIFWRRHSSIVSVVKGLCQKELTAESADEYSKMGTLNLFTAVQCMFDQTERPDIDRVGQVLTN